MTQAFNLSQLANSVNSSGQLSGSAVNGTVSSATTATNATNLTGGTCTIGTTQLGAGNASLMKSRIINGAMVIDQRNAGASVTPTNGQYTLDRWQGRLTAASKFSIQQSSTAPTGFNNSIIATSLSAYSVGSTDGFFIQQRIEGYNVADLGWGTANAKTVTLSFWVRSSLTGTFGGSLFNDNADRSYPFTYTISSANTWTQASVTIAGDTTGTWLTTNGNGLSVNFSLGAGSTVSGTAGSWAGTTYYSATGATSVVGTSGATFYITGVQLEVGSSATGFEYRQYQQELALCQRYCFNVTAPSGTPVCLFGAVSSSVGWAMIPFPVTPRVPPTGLTSVTSNWIMNSFGSGSTPAQAVSFLNSTLENITVQTTGGGAMVGGTVGQFYPNAGAGQFYTTGSEL